MLLGLVSRPTRDLDAVASVGRTLGLSDDRLNPGPTELLRFGLPKGFEQRVQRRSYGGLILHVAGRLDQICFKLYAAVDQGAGSKHAADLRRLDPTQEDLLTAARWSRTHDPSDGYREALAATLGALGVEVTDADL